jgi:hypothetical protein
VDFPERLSGRTIFGSPYVGHPIDHHVAGPRPWTQIRLGAGTPQRISYTKRSHIGGVHELNQLSHCVSRVGQLYGGSLSASRSFVLAALRAFHLDPDSGPPNPAMTREQAKQLEISNGSTFTGDPNTDKELPCPIFELPSWASA